MSRRNKKTSSIRTINKRKGSQRTKKRRPVGRRRGPEDRLGFVQLSQINNKPILTRCIRYVQAASMTQLAPAAFLTSDILTSIGFVISGSTAYYPVIECFKLLRVGIRVMPDTDGYGSVTFSWQGTNTPSTADVNYYNVGIPASKSYYPPADSSSSWWWDNSATAVPLFTVFVQVTGSEVPQFFLDLEFQYVMVDGTVTSVPVTNMATYNGTAFRYLPQTTEDFSALGVQTIN